MKKLAYALAALATIAIVTPTIASAEEFGIQVGGDRDMYRDHRDRDREFRGARAEFGYGEHDRGRHRGWYRGEGRGHDRVVIIKRHRHWDD